MLLNKNSYVQYLNTYQIRKYNKKKQIMCGSLWNMNLTYTFLNKKPVYQQQAVRFHPSQLATIKTTD